MDTQKLHDLIDKVIGKSGPLRTPAWWMRRVLRSLIDFINDVKAEILKAMDAMRKEFVGIERGYTYAELKQLKDAGRLVPGQRYVMTDYRFTASLIPPSLDPEVKLTAGNRTMETLLILTASSQSEFDRKALFKQQDRGYNEIGWCEVDYIFDRVSSHLWCLAAYELNPMYAVNTGTGEEMHLELLRVEKRSGSYRMYYRDVDNDKEYYYGIDMVSRASLPNTMLLKNDENSNLLYIKVTPDKSVDPYRGIIVRMVNPERHIDVPFDYTDANISFSLETPFGLESVSDKPVVDNYGRNQRNVRIRKLVYDGYYFFPVLCQEGGYHVDMEIAHYAIISDGFVTLTGYSHHVSVTTPYCKLHNVTNCHIGGAASGNTFNGWKTICNVKDSTFNLGLLCPTIEDSTNIKVEYSKGIAPWPCTISVGKNSGLVEIKLEKRYVGKDSNGNIRQWNPADFVDAVEPEEQTVEQSETVEE